ncbi:uncharacterized protein LY79DRAFT_244687 [Colletotrichum navitas]|uniref:Uncharacterized protein n=1 Tax=Colletotrichum navitas TaxID=681940 RepID=A0AAD8PYF8_9PEZI|nr:uncharacterized protein LY79DRAFT_244687 [Colletotrichum navitas]KAK1586023.1 hypothetical protein LY79DRAFT_244687 [Colletotrichum navitas]
MEQKVIKTEINMSKLVCIAATKKNWGKAVPVVLALREKGVQEQWKRPSGVDSGKTNPHWSLSNRDAKENAVGFGVDDVCRWAILHGEISLCRRLVRKFGFAEKPPLRVAARRSPGWVESQSSGSHVQYPPATDGPGAQHTQVIRLPFRAL